MKRRRIVRTGLLVALGIGVGTTLTRHASAYDAGIGVYRPSTNQFWLRQELTPGTPDIAPYTYGAPGDIPIVGDWDGDGTTTAGIYRPPGMPFNGTTSGRWILTDSYSGEFVTYDFYYGQAGDIPVVGDWDGNGTTTIGVFRPSTQEWILRNENSGGPNDIPTFSYGAADDLPVPGDWDGNGTVTVGVFRPANAPWGGPNPEWLLRNSNTPGPVDITTFTYGAPGDTGVVGDWDGNGTMTIGVYRPSTQQWLLRNENNGGQQDIGPFTYGQSGDRPVVGQAWIPQNLVEIGPPLQVGVVQQQDSLWCWDAVTNMVTQYFVASESHNYSGGYYPYPPGAAEPSGAPSQCQIADTMEASEGGWGSPPSQIDCCANPGACDHGGDPGASLCQAGYKATWGGPMSFDALLTEIGAYRPVVFVVNYNAGGQHDMVVNQVADDADGPGAGLAGGQWVNVLDPGYDDSELMPYDVWSNTSSNLYSFTLAGQYSNIFYLGVGKCISN
jgi:hypothetical protein